MRSEGLLICQCSHPIENHYQGWAHCFCCATNCRVFRAKVAR